MASYVSFPDYYHPADSTPCRHGSERAGVPCVEHGQSVMSADEETYRNLMHTKRCLAGAMIAALENMRDDEWVTHFDFRIAAQENQALTLADGYLADGTFTCIC